MSGEDRDTLQVRVCFRCDGEDETELQGYGDEWVTLMVTVRGQVQR